MASTWPADVDVALDDRTRRFRPRLLDWPSDVEEWRHRLLASPGASIAGGTSEILRSVLAERVLGLPREPFSR
ncbi:MAG: hypothetical protein ACRD0O_03240 [Acidimicrobiia bacterium]